MSLDKWLKKRFDRQNYNCLHFACDVWADLTNEDVALRLQGLLGRVSGRAVAREHVKAFVRLERSCSPCLVLFQAPRMAPHVGIYLNGRVLHIRSKGVEYMPIDLAMRGFKTAKFYR